MYEPYRTRNGYCCKVRVNNREYCTDVPYESEDLARDGAAMKAFMICRNFSANDGMYPGQRPGQTSASGIVQGRPVAIGTGRRSNRSSTAGSEGSSSGGNSPKSVESGFDQQMRQVAQQMPRTNKRPHQRRDNTHRREEYVCYCTRGPVYQYGRCVWCCRDNGWDRV